MKITRFLTIALLSGAFLSSCNDEVREAGLTGSGEVSYASISLHDTPTLKSVSQGADEEGSATERKIQSLEFYVFDANGDRDQNESNEGYVKITAIEANHQYTFAVSSGIGKKILVAANLDLGEMAGANIDAVRATMHDVEITSPVAAQQLIPMAGEATFSVASGSVQNVPIAVSRFYSKFTLPTAAGAEVKIAVDSEDYAELKTIFEAEGKTLSGNLAFDLKGFVVVNGLKKSFVFENYGDGIGENQVWDENVWTIGNDINNYTASQYTADKKLGTVYSGGSFLTGGAVYLYENAPVRSTFEGIKGFDPQSVYALIIEADFICSVTGDKVTRYWRINVNNTEERVSIYKILRNAIYNVDITEIHTIGHGTPGEAEEEKPIIPDVDEAGIKAIITTAPWRVFNESTTI